MSGLVRPESDGPRNAKPTTGGRAAPAWRALLGAKALAEAVSLGSAQRATAAAVTLNVLDRATDPKRIDCIKWLAESFHTQHTGAIHIDLNTIGDDYHQKVNLVLKGSNPPDVFFSWEGG